MKVAYVGIDVLYPALTSLYDTGSEIVKIFTCKTDNVTEFNTKVVEFANTHGIPLQMERITQADLRELVTMGCEFVLVGGYYFRIPVIDELRIVNTHPALLPLGRGGWPTPVTILKGLKESGVTMHKMVLALDEGDILLQEKVPVYADDDLTSLTERQWSVIPQMVKRLVADFDRLWENAAAQGENAEYWEMPEEKDYTVTDQMSFEEADLILRAFYSYECFYLNVQTKEKLELIGATAHKGAVPRVPEGTKTFPLTDGYVLCDRVRRLL